MNCLIVDDNKIARTTMKQLAGFFLDIVVIKECADAAEAFNFLEGNPVDLVLLDIEMPGMSGIELTKNLGINRPLIIFTTSKKEYAAEAFELLRDMLLQKDKIFLCKASNSMKFCELIQHLQEV